MIVWSMVEASLFVRAKIDTHSFSIEGLNVSGVDLTCLLKELEAFDDILKPPEMMMPLPCLFFSMEFPGPGRVFWPAS